MYFVENKGREPRRLDVLLIFYGSLFHYFFQPVAIDRIFISSSSYAPRRLRNVINLLKKNIFRSGGEGERQFIY